MKNMRPSEKAADTALGLMFAHYFFVIFVIEVKLF